MSKPNVQSIIATQRTDKKRRTARALSFRRVIAGHSGLHRTAAKPVSKFHAECALLLRPFCRGPLNERGGSARRES